jgi:hypothetical protein
MIMKFRCILLIAVTGTFSDATLLAEDKLPYAQDFEKVEVGSVPPDFMVLEGGFAVKQAGTNKFLELPGAPLDSYSVQFGPSEAENISVAAAFNGTAKGRRFPVFGVGLDGIAGYRLQVSPAKKMLELYKDQELKASVSYDWKSGEWLNLRLQITKSGDGTWKVAGKIWPRDGQEPSQWIITASETEQPQAGRASVFGSPFAGTPIQFDDFKVERAGGTH